MQTSLLLGIPPTLPTDDVFQLALHLKDACPFSGPIFLFFLAKSLAGTLLEDLEKTSLETHTSCYILNHQRSILYAKCPEAWCLQSDFVSFSPTHQGFSNGTSYTSLDSSDDGCETWSLKEDAEGKGGGGGACVTWRQDSGPSSFGGTKWFHYKVGKFHQRWLIWRQLRLEGSVFLWIYFIPEL